MLIRDLFVGSYVIFVLHVLFNIFFCFIGVSANLEELVLIVISYSSIQLLKRRN